MTVGEALWSVPNDAHQPDQLLLYFFGCLIFIKWF